MINIKARKGESFERMLRRFSKTFEESGILADYKDGRYYEKPSERRRKQRKQFLRNQKNWNKLFN